MMSIIDLLVTSQSVGIKDLKMYYVLCIFPGSKKIANSVQRLDFTGYLVKGLKHSQIIKVNLSLENN